MSVQELSGSKNKNKLHSGAVKSKTVSTSDSIDLDLPGTSKESSPALSFAAGELGTSRASRSESVDIQRNKLPIQTR